MLTRSLRVLAISLLALLSAGPATAEQIEKMGDYVVHYNAFDSTFLSADVARQYGITRSKYQGVINIAVQKAGDAGQDVPVTARLSGKVKNDIAQSNDLDFREIKDGPAIYYIATFSHGDKEKLSFDLNVQPEGKGEPKPLKFDHQFFAN